MRRIVFGGSGSGGASSDGWDTAWMAKPTYDSTQVNGRSDVMGILCNVLNISDRNYFSCLATTNVGTYTVSVYTAPGGTLISSQDVASNAQCNWQINYSACTHQLDTETRQAWVEIYPTAGALTSIAFNTNHPAETNVNSAQNIVGAIGALPAVTTMASCFSYCYSLQSVIFPALPAVTTMASCFGACYSLQSVTLPSLPAVTTMVNCFGACYSLQSVTLPSLPAVTTMVNCFGYCYSLQSVTLPSLPAVTTMTNCFYACYSLHSVTLPSLPAVTTMTSCFESCYSLQSVTLPSLPAVTSMANCFGYCYSLHSVTLPSLPAVTNMTSCFSICYSLQSVIFPALPAVTTMASCFSYCYSLQSVTLPSLPEVTTMTNCFGAAVTEAQSLRSLRKIILSGLRYGFALNYGALQSQEINALFTSLGTANGAQTIDVRNQPGSTTCDVSIAVLKGYTVVTA